MDNFIKKRIVKTIYKRNIFDNYKTYLFDIYLAIFKFEMFNNMPNWQKP